MLFHVSVLIIERGNQFLSRESCSHFFSIFPLESKASHLVALKCLTKAVGKRRTLQICDCYKIYIKNKGSELTIHADGFQKMMKICNFFLSYHFSSSSAVAWHQCFVKKLQRKRFVKFKNTCAKCKSNWNTVEITNWSISSTWKWQILRKIWPILNEPSNGISNLVTFQARQL